MARPPDPELRADPDSLLTLAAGEARGKLTVFLGAAPGVGKTYAMLERAARLRREGTDIVIGLIETHGRAETAALIEGLEIIPRRTIDVSGRAQQEFDLDAALARSPTVVVLDELAHSNVAGSRHPKRYFDVLELLDAGIDVWTAVNIQHLESLSDVVAQITGIEVRERVPDTILARADEVVLIDLPPAELIERLHAGKVYLPATARRAAENFFRLGNLSALRELALRRTADRVDDQVVDYRRRNAIETSWPNSEKLVVCIGPDALSERVVRASARLASGLNAAWLVVSIERADASAATGDQSRRLDETFRLAEQLGAETRRITGADFVEEILRAARRENATQIVIGARPRGLFRRFRRSLPDALLRGGSGLSIHVISGEEAEPAPPREPPPPWRETATGIGAAIALVAAASLAGWTVTRWVELPNISLLFLVAVLIAAVGFGRASAIAAAVLSVLAYDVFFIFPLGTLYVAQPHQLLALLIFMLAAILVGGLAARVKEQARGAQDRAASNQALYDFARKLSATADADDVGWAAVSQLRALLDRGVVLLLPQNGDLGLAAAWPPDTDLELADRTAARWAFEKREPAGAGTGTLPNSRLTLRPLLSPHGVVGVVGYEVGDRPPLESETVRAFEAILDQTAIAIDRARLSRESLDQATRLEGERFSQALLSSISHDLRTPLASITGAVTSLRQLGDRMTPESRDDLLASIEEESARLSQFVANLLDMTRIESKALNAKRDWVDVADVIRTAVVRAQKLHPGRVIETSLSPDLPLIRGDSVLLGQALFNLIDNATRYGRDEPVSIFARSEGDGVKISVTDLGKGIPEKDLERIFEKFFRRAKADGRSPGSGLGLAIARGFVEAMGGRIRAESPAQKRRGTRVTVTLPVESDADAGPPK